MPKLIGIEEKYINGIKVDKENDECFFNDEKHLYINKADGKNYISVTTLIGQYHEQFDADFWSSYKALEKILDPELFSIVKKTLLAKKVFDPKLIYKLKIDQELFDKEKQAILDEYKSNNKEACDRGTAIHLEKELSFYNRNNFNFNKYGFKELGGEFDCKENYFKLDLDRGVYPEFLISYIFPKADLRISGQIDLLVKDGNDIYIIDWKTNKEIKKHSYYNKFTKKYNMMKFPVNNLQDCNFNHYQLQLSMYAFMLQLLHPEYNIKGLKIVHIDHDGKQHEYDCEYLKDEVKKMLKHYNKMRKINEKLDAIKPINIC